MAEQHILAVHTYGSQRVKHPMTNQKVSAYKLGYSSAACEVLLALYGTKARDVSSSRASYRYLQIDGETTVHHGYLLLNLTADELAQAEGVTRRHHRAAVFLWRGSQWLELPTNRQAEYTETTAQSGPGFNPSSYRPVTPASGEKQAAVEGIQVEKSQRDPNQKPWFWLAGDTYPHRELLKRSGARFSGKRKSWYYVGWALPAAIQAIITTPTQANEPPRERRSPLLSIFGGGIVGKERTSNHDTIVKGENGVFATRTTWVNQHDQPEVVWVFDLPPHERIGISLPAIHDALKAVNATFSLYTRKWHFDQPNKVAALDALAAAVPFSDDDPCTVEEAAHILGLPVKPVPAVEVPPRLFALDQTIYARHELQTPDGKVVQTGTPGTILHLYNHNTQHGWSYDVDFAESGTGWYFERELSDLEPIPGIRITHGSVVPPGATLPPTDADIKHTLIETHQQPERKAEPQPDNTAADEPKIRIIKPQSLPAEGAEPDAVQTAIQQMTVTLPSNMLQVIATSSNSKSLTRISQRCVGELSGSISGQVWCFGYALHEGMCVYLNFGGPRMATEAIRAKLSKGDIVSVTPWDAPAVELTAGEGNSGMYTAFMQHISEAKFTSLILLHDWVVNPNYGGKAVTFIFRVSETQAAAQLKHHITELVKVPVFDEWTAYLYQAGQAAMLVRKTRAGGEIDLLTLNLDVDAWT
ncbi:MAG: hypothetical protein SF123_15365, partial [Chloroflexota bacterium]|nr:hypothetical protein [Chloroflexota bacterium]